MAAEAGDYRTDGRVMGITGIHPSDGTDGCHEGATEHVRTASCGPTWLLQTEAAARTGFSVSAIRKWRRMGVVADRKVSGPGGLERVEVKLEDVQARAALQPERPRSEAAPDSARPQPGRVVIAIDDLESLFERMVDAERRADHAEAEVESLRSQAQFMYGQLAELRRQLEDPATAAADPAEPSRPTSEAPEIIRPENKLSSAPSCAEPVRGPVSGKPPSAGVPNGRSGRIGPTAVEKSQVVRKAAQLGRPSAAPATGQRHQIIEELVRELRQIYGRLDEFRRMAAVTPEVERQRQQTLLEYDRQLLAVCAALRVPTGFAAGEQVTVEARGSLTRALARAGFDVRADLREPASPKPRRIRLGQRL